MRFNTNDGRTPPERTDGELLRRVIEQDPSVMPDARGGQRGLRRGDVTEPDGRGASCRCAASPRRGVGMSGGINGGTTGQTSWGLYGYPLAMVYSPVQSFDSLFEPGDGLAAGTIFRELALPLEMRGGCRQ